MLSHRLEKLETDLLKQQEQLEEQKELTVSY
jgi:hypothetical protein